MLKPTLRVNIARRRGFVPTPLACVGACVSESSRYVGPLDHAPSVALAAAAGGLAPLCLPALAATAVALASLVLRPWLRPLLATAAALRPEPVPA
jgi:hypothetical protein